MDHATESPPDDRWYSPDHLWIDEAGRVGISGRLARWLPNLVNVHLPPVGTDVFAAEPFASLEADKGAFDLHAPCDGRVLEHNPALARRPELVSDDPYGAGWLARIGGSARGLLRAADYAAHPGYAYPAFRKEPR